MSSNRHVVTYKGRPITVEALAHLNAIFAQLNKDRLDDALLRRAADQHGVEVQFVLSQPA